MERAEDVLQAYAMISSSIMLLFTSLQAILTLILMLLFIANDYFDAS